MPIKQAYLKDCVESSTSLEKAKNVIAIWPIILRDGPFFCTGFQIRTTLKFRWVGGSEEMTNPERCTDLFVVMLKLHGGWMGQNQSKRCSNLEICTEKWTVPYIPKPNAP